MHNLNLNESALLFPNKKMGLEEECFCDAVTFKKVMSTQETNRNLWDSPNSDAIILINRVVRGGVVHGGGKMEWYVERQTDYN